MLADPSCTGHEQSFTMLFFKSVNGITVSNLSMVSMHFNKFIGI